MVRKVSIRNLPDPGTMAAAIDAIASHQPASRTYKVMTAVAYYAGLRPSEVVMLRAKALELPTEGWGHLHVTEADIAFDQPGEPKTGPRSVPIPPQLVDLLRGWLDAGGFSGDDLLFRTRSGRRPTASNWSRAFQRALRDQDLPPLRIYDCRHAAATTWLAAGVPLGEVAKRMGHSVETLVSTYVGALHGDQALANERIRSRPGRGPFPPPLPDPDLGGRRLTPWLHQAGLRSSAAPRRPPAGNGLGSAVVGNVDSYPQLGGGPGDHPADVGGDTEPELPAHGQARRQCFGDEQPGAAVAPCDHRRFIEERPWVQYLEDSWIGLSDDRSVGLRQQRQGLREPPRPGGVKRLEQPPMSARRKRQVVIG